MGQITLRSVTAVLVTLLMIVSVGPATAVAGSQAQLDAGQTMQDEDDGMEPADEIYIEENGDAVLVSENEDSSDGTTGEFGVDIASGLMHVLVTDPIENAEETDPRGQASLLLTDSEFDGSGYVNFQQEEPLEEFQMEFTGETTSDNSVASLSLDAAFNTSEAPSAGLLQSADTSGTITTTGSSITADGQFSASLAGPVPASEASTSFSLTEDDGSYTVDVERNRQLSSFQTDGWQTREQAKQTIQEQFGSNAAQLGGSATVTIERYNYTEIDSRSARLDIAYTVEYQNLKSQLSQQVALALVSDSEVDISQEEADRLASQMEKLTINEIAASYSAQPGEVTADFAVDIDNYDDVALAALEIAQNADTEEMDGAMMGNIDRLRSTIEAQQAADLTQELTWEGEVTSPDSGTKAVSFQADQTTENWGAYVQELQSRDIETPETTFEFTGSSDGDRVNITGTMSVEGALLDQMNEQFASASEGDQEAQQFLTAFQDADLQKSKLDMSVDGETVEIEAGAQFNNLTALRDTLAQEGEIPAGLTSVVGETEDGTTTTYARVEGAVGSDATESDVRALEYVDSETIIYMPGEGDRDFPSMDTDRASSYLADTDDGGDEGTEQSSGDGAGFGVVAALIAVLSVALLARRRQ